MDYAGFLARGANVLVGALKTETERMPDFERGMGAPQIQGLRSPDIGGGTGTLLMKDGPFYQSNPSLGLDC